MGGRGWRWCLLVFCTFTPGAACGAFDTEAAQPVPPSDSGSDVSSDASTDAGETEDAATTDGGDGRIFSDGFEDGFDCTDWYPSATTLKHSDAGRTGASSCKVCITNNGTAHAFRYNVKAAGAGKYQFELWTRQASADAASVYINMVLTADGGDLSQQPTSSGVVQTADWQPSSVALSVSKDVQSADLRLHLEGMPNDCIFLDDVALRHQP